MSHGGTGASLGPAALTNLGAAPIASPTFTGTVTTPILALGTLTTAAQITADKNDYDPGITTSSVFSITSDAARNITGLLAGSTGQVVILLNSGAFSITLKPSNASSSANNRFSAPADVIVRALGAVLLIYAGSRWKIIAP